jgi:hypothetical protein
MKTTPISRKFIHNNVVNQVCHDGVQALSNHNPNSRSIKSLIIRIKEEYIKQTMQTLRTGHGACCSFRETKGRS